MDVGAHPGSNKFNLFRFFFAIGLQHSQIKRSTVYQHSSRIIDVFSITGKTDKMLTFQKKKKKTVSLSSQYIKSGLKQTYKQTKHT